MSDPSLQYLTQSQIDACEHKDLAGLTTEGWYFWDETWTVAHGPYPRRGGGARAAGRVRQTLERRSMSSETELFKRALVEIVRLRFDVARTAAKVDYHSRDVRRVLDEAMSELFSDVALSEPDAWDVVFAVRGKQQWFKTDYDKGVLDDRTPRGFKPPARPV